MLRAADLAGLKVLQLINDNAAGGLGCLGGCGWGGLGVIVCGEFVVTFLSVGGGKG